MQYFKDYQFYYFSTESVTSAEERSEIVQQELGAAKEFFKTSFAPEDNLVGNIKKYFPVVLFLTGVILAVVFSLMKMVTACVCTFGAIFTVFGIIAMLPVKHEDETLKKKPGKSKLPTWFAGLICIGFGISIIIPTLMSSVIGVGKSVALTGAMFFTLGGLFFLCDTLIRAVRSRTAYTEDVTGTCIGYVKMTDGSSNNNGRGRIYIVGTPVFEYYYNGQTYQAFQDNDMRTGALKPAVGSVEEIKVNPSDPYDIKYHNNTGGRIFAMIMALLCLGVGIFLFAYLPNVSDSGVKISTLSGEVGNGKARFDDDMIAEYITGDFTVSYVTVEKKYQEDGVWLVDLSDGQTRRLGDDDVDKYEVGTAFYIVSPVGGGSGINFLADDWEYSGSHTVHGAP